MSDEYQIVIIAELDKILDEYMSILNIKGFIKIKTNKCECETLSTINDLVYKSLSDGISYEGISEHSYKIVLGSKSIILTYGVCYFEVFASKVSRYIKVNDCGFKFDISAQYDGYPIRSIRILCNNYIIDAARSHTKSARN